MLGVPRYFRFSTYKFCKYVNSIKIGLVIVIRGFPSKILHNKKHRHRNLYFLAVGTVAHDII